MIIDEVDTSNQNRNPWWLCSLNQVEEVKLVLRLIPIWLSCLMFGVIQAQLHTFFTNKVAQQSDQSVPISKSLQHHFKDLIGIGLVISILNMVVSAQVEAKRLNVAKHYNLIDKPKAIIPMKVWWLLPQYLICGVSDAFTTVGLQELFYDQMPEQMRSMGAAAFISVIGVGSFISSGIISIVQSITSRNGEKWLGDNINRAHLDYFYWVLAVLSTLSLCVYVLITRAFVYRKIGGEEKLKAEMSLFAKNHDGGET
ncbi:hypothetical protein PRUPE_2G034800 [Prunus persica]|uniref:Major facilitator superfamily (MFS) profile domain-containing protein n=1 Tax=Prunus persica TaxID=3760 RepID=A0A251QAL0_PRUPE|nr:hypothetical protein PRUPE_2G034800 [Prunus persica]